MDMIINYINQLSPTVWLIASFILIGIETLAPVAIFLWLGVSCVLLAIFSYSFTIAPMQQVILYAILAPVITYLGRYFVPIRLRNRHEQNINRKIDQMIGMEFKLSAAIENGRAQAKIGDSVWPVQGPDLNAGTHVRVIGLEGNTLQVEAILNL